jgi:2-keto-4-pentenoate hydratase/2-oxohepta-3-ene-1,7-dioic acid hydratase in catechol pathway
MTLKLVTFYANEKLKIGVKTEKGIIDLSKANHIPGTVKEIIIGGRSILAKIDQYIQQNQDYLTEAELKLGPCIPEPGKIICVGLNYRKHAIESNMPIPQFPILFNKFENSIASHLEDVTLPPDAEQIDYEAELAIIIGTTAKNVSEDEALDYVYGYCNANDLSARDLQFRTNQWLLGKCLDGFNPIGPYLVTSEEVGNPNDLRIQAVVNGELRQNSNTADMIFNCKEIISYVTKYMTLKPGDLILTGTPEGVVFGYPMDKQIWLKSGDVVSIEIEKLGTLTNRMV